MRFGKAGVFPGQRPIAVAGKPSPEPFLEAARRYGSQRPLVIGDRLDTDIEGGCAAKIPTLVVLTGVSLAGDLLRAGRHERPSYLGVDLAALLVEHPSVEVSATVPGSGRRAMCRDSIVELVNDGSASSLRVIAATGEPLDLLRAACALAWVWADDEPGGGSPEVSCLVVDEVLATLRSITSGAPWAR